MKNFAPIFSLFLFLTAFQGAGACSIFKFPVRLAKVAVRTPGSVTKASIDTVKMAGISLIFRLGGYRDPK